MRALNDRVIVETIPDKATFGKGVLYRPDNPAFYPLPDRGKVIAVGPGKLNGDGTRTPCNTRVGDLVAFKKSVGYQIEYRGRTLVFLKDQQVFMRVERSHD